MPPRMAVQRWCAATFRIVRLLANSDNRGFTGGNNDGLASQAGPGCSFSIPIPLSAADALDQMLAYLEAHPDVGVVGPQLRYGDGSLQSSRRRFPTLATALFESTPLAWHWPAERNPLGTALSHGTTWRQIEPRKSIGWSAQRCLPGRRCSAQVGGFDEGYFMYSEELDWQRRVKQAGWKIVYLPEAVITHYEGKSSEQATGARHIRFNRSKVRYFRKHHGPLQAEFLRLALLTMFGIEWAVEAAKYMLGSQRAMRRGRLSAVFAVDPVRTIEVGSYAHSVSSTGEYPVMQGGVGDYTRRLSQAMGLLGADVHVLTHVDAGGDHLRAPAAGYEPTVYPRLERPGLEPVRTCAPDDRRGPAGCGAHPVPVGCVRPASCREPAALPPASAAQAPAGCRHIPRP